MFAEFVPRNIVRNLFLSQGIDVEVAQRGWKKIELITLLIYLKADSKVLFV
jgi:hypothetical protein